MTHTPEFDASLDRAAQLLRSATGLTVLTGAGVSAESGVSTFRGVGGLWEGNRIEDVASPDAFRSDPKLLWRFYNLRRANRATVRPNPGHDALAQMEQRWGSDHFTLVTQNVDGLHQEAGSRNVVEVHGSLLRVRCTGTCGTTDRGTEELPELPVCAGCGQLLRPDVVWFGEMLPPEVWTLAVRATGACNAFLVVGTSAVVYPAAGLIVAARAVGAAVIEVNPEATPAREEVDVCLRGPSGVVLPALLERVKKGADS
jgi:NAD-dependent deacetylase